VLDDHHLLNVENAKMVGLQRFLFLVDEWNEVDVGLVVVAELEGKIDVASLGKLLFVDELLEWHLLGVLLANL